MKKMVLALLVLLCFIKVDAMAADTTWQEDYDYTLQDTEQEIHLTTYHGTEENLTIPAKATVGGVEYTTRVLQNDHERPYNPWEYSSVKSIAFESGVRAYALDFLFWNCTDLEEVDLSNLDVPEIYYINSMFLGCNSLKEVDLSMFDFTNVIEAYNMFYDCSSLNRITTPQNVKRSIELPAAFYDASYNSYTTLPQSSLTLTRGPVNASSAKISVSSQVYTGKALKPAPVVKLGSHTIDKSNYSVSYSNNTEPGTANIKVSFSGNFTGSVKSTFQITHTHTPVVLPAKEPTADETGLTEGKKCSVCGKILVEQKVIPKVVVEVKEKDRIEVTTPKRKVKLQVKVKNAVIKRTVWSIPKKKERKWAKITNKSKYQAKVKAKKAGLGHTVHIKAVITYTIAPKARPMNHASLYAKEKTYTIVRIYSLGITQKSNLISKITLSGPGTVKVGKTIKIRAKKTPSNKTSVTWHCTKEGRYISKSKNGKFTGLKKGKGHSVKVWCEANDSRGKMSPRKTIYIR